MNNPKNLISGFIHSLDQGLACSLGVNAALIYNHIVYWLHFNSQKKDCEKIEGRIWMYETQEAIAESMGYLTVDEVKKAMKLLLDSRLIIKGNFNKNPFDKTNWYTVFDQEIISKKRNSKKSYESAVPHDRESPTAPSDSAVPHDRTLYIQTKDTEEKQQQEAPPAAVLFDKIDKKTSKLEKAKNIGLLGAIKDQPYSCMLNADIPFHEKIWITETYDEETVKHAIAWANHKETKINTSLAQALKWACKTKPGIPKDPEDLTEENREHAHDVVKHLIPSTISYVAISYKSIEIGNKPPDHTIPDIIEFQDKHFKQKLQKALIKRKFETTRSQPTPSH